MSDYDHSGKSLLARFRSLFGRRSRALCVGAFLGGGALMGMPIKPEEIEEHMRDMSRTRIVQIVEREQELPGQPDLESEIRLTVRELRRK